MHKKLRTSFYAERKALLPTWHKGFGKETESKNACEEWIQQCTRKSIPAIDVAFLIDQVQLKTSKEGILDVCIRFAQEQQITNPLLYAPSLEGFKTRKTFITELMNNLMEQLINPTTQENK
jgi:hypothetical protein